MIPPLHRSDSGDIVLSWLTRMAVALAVVGVTLFDAVAITAAHVTVRDDATEEAMAASEAWHSRPDIQGAYNAAEAVAEVKGEFVLTSGFTVDPDGRVHLRVRRQVTTLVAHRIGPLRKYTSVVESGDANSAP